MNRTGALLCGLMSFGGCRDKTVPAAVRCTMRQSQQRLFEWSVQGSLHECPHPHSQHICNHGIILIFDKAWGKHSTASLPLFLNSNQMAVGKEQKKGARTKWKGRVGS